MMRKGIILAGGTGSRLSPLTTSVSKQLMPVYDKPMIYYPLATLMQIGIREVLIITTQEDAHLFERLLADGKQWGMEIKYAVQAMPRGIAMAYTIAKDFLDGAPSVLILGDNLFHGDKMVQSFQNANNSYRSTIFGYEVSDPSAYGVVSIAANGGIIDVIEKPKEFVSPYAIPGIYFFDSDASEYASTLKPSARGEFEIVDVMREYIKTDRLDAIILDRGNVWLDTGTIDSLLDAAQYVQIIEKRTGVKIACVEEIALQHYWITKAEILERAQFNKSAYSNYLREMVKRY